MERSLLWKIIQIIARIWTTLMFDLKTYGRNNVPAKGGVLLAANHQSYLDPVLVSVHLKRPVSFMAKYQLFENPRFAWFIRQLHAFPVRQGEGDIAAVKESIRRLNEGEVLNIYPEGTRTLDGEIRPMEKGIALVIRKARVPVIPVTIDGSFESWPKGSKMFHRHPIRIIYGKPMHMDKMKGDQIVSELEKAMRSQYAQLKAMRQKTK